MLTQRSKGRRLEELRGNAVSSALRVEERCQKSFLNLLWTRTNMTTLQRFPSQGGGFTFGESTRHTGQVCEP